MPSQFLKLTNQTAANVCSDGSQYRTSCCIKLSRGNSIWLQVTDYAQSFSVSFIISQFWSYSIFFSHSLQECSLETQYMVKCCQEAAGLSQAIAAASEVKPVTHLVIVSFCNTKRTLFFKYHWFVTYSMKPSGNTPWICTIHCISLCCSFCSMLMWFSDKQKYYQILLCAFHGSSSKSFNLPVSK